MTTRSGAWRWKPTLLLAFAADTGFGQPLPLGDEFAVNENTTGAQNSVVVEAADESDGGAFYFAWRDASGDQDVFLRRYEADGTPGAAAPINQVIALPQTSPAIDVNDDGEAVVAWRSLAQFGSGSGQDLVFRLSSDDGTTFSDEERGNDAIAFEPGPKISAARGPGLDATLAWTDGGVFYRRFDASGTPMTGDLTATTTPGAAELVVGHGEQSRIVLVYSAPDADQSGIHARIVDPFGAEIVPEFRVNELEADQQIQPALGVDSAGNFLVAWRGQAERRIELRRFGRLGEPLGAEQLVRDAETTVVGPPAIDVGARRRFRRRLARSRIVRHRGHLRPRVHAHRSPRRRPVPGSRGHGR